MANKDALRELQTRLASRLQAAKTQPRARGWLAVECAGVGLLLPLLVRASESRRRGYS